jgi:hypothetical protein
LGEQGAGSGEPEKAVSCKLRQEVEVGNVKQVDPKQAVSKLQQQDVHKIVVWQHSNYYGRAPVGPIVDRIKGLAQVI